MKPSEFRESVRQRRHTGPTAGCCPGYAQANLVVLPKDMAYDFLLFAQRNPKSCPLLEVTDTGSRFLREIAPGADIARDLPKYRVYEHGVLTYAMDIFTRQGKLWRREQEQHEERAWEPDWLAGQLAQAGFADIRRYGNRRFDPPAEDEERIFFLARKGII